MDGKQINLITLAPGAVVRINGDAWMRVTENPGAREENLCAVDILEVLSETKTTDASGS